MNDKIKSFLVQIGATAPDGWATVQAPDMHEAIATALRESGVIGKGERPTTAYVALGGARHDNGAPIAVQSYQLNYEESKPQPNPSRR